VKNKFSGSEDKMEGKNHGEKVKHEKHHNGEKNKHEKKKDRQVKDSYDFGDVILGKGGFSTVYLGRKIEDGFTVAVKCLDKESIDPERLNTSMREPDILVNLDHPNVVKIFDVFDSPKHLFLVLEFVEHGSLFKVMKRYGVFPPDLILFCVEQILHGLEYLHSNSIMHRDIKSDNILLHSDCTVKLGDFGTAKSEDLNTKFTVIGTPYWMAPEIIELSGGGTKSDIWSLGCTIIELLVGQPPYFDLKKMAALFRIVQDPHPPIPENISEELNRFLMSCFNKDYKERPSCDVLFNHPWIKSIENTKEPKTILEFTQMILEHNHKMPPSNELTQSTESDSNEVIVNIQKQLDDVTKERDSLKKRNKMLEKLLDDMTLERNNLQEELAKLGR